MRVKRSVQNPTAGAAGAGAGVSRKRKGRRNKNLRFENPVGKGPKKPGRPGRPNRLGRVPQAGIEARGAATSGHRSAFAG